MRHILLNLKNMAVIKATDGEEALACCELWAELLIPRSEYYVFGVEYTDLKTFTESEMDILILSLPCAKHLGNMDHAEKAKLLGRLLNEMPIDDKTAKQLRRKLSDKKRKVDKPAHTKEVPKEGVPVRPEEGTRAIKVWEAADWFARKFKSYAMIRAKTVEACVGAGVMKEVAFAQFEQWKANRLGKSFKR